MAVQDLFLDTNIIADYIIPSRRIKYACSYELLARIQKGDFNAYSADYTLSETLGLLKQSREEKLGLSHIDRETLSTKDILDLVSLIDEFRKTPNFQIFVPNPVSQADIFEKVKSICVQATDALVLLSVMELKTKLDKVVLVTRDDRLLVRGRHLVDTAHPIDFFTSCPVNCASKLTCKHAKKFKQLKLTATNP